MAALKAPKYPIPLTAEMRQQADQELEARGEEPDWPVTIQNYEAAFRDATGRPGPAGWELGRYPKDQADFPVTGISWFEAAAYCEYAGKALPTDARSSRRVHARA